MSARQAFATARRTEVRPAPLARSVLQRRCACGNEAANGECEACAQRKAARGHDAQDEAAGVPPIVHDVLRSAGQPLDAGARAFMETRFGHDFSDVRVHAGGDAVRSADAVNAEAYTVGHDIVFGAGRYAPATTSGRKLLAHELAHVVQQRPAAPVAPEALGVSHSEADEAHADRAAAAAMDGVQDGAQAAGGRRAASAGLQRKDAGGTNDNATGDANDNASTNANGNAPASPCIEAVVGEDIPSLFEAGAVTIVEFGADWCEPCKINLASLQALCAKLRVQPPPVPVRIYSIDVDQDANKKVGEQYAPGSVPHLYIYVGATEKQHFNSAVEPDVMEALVGDVIEYAATPGWRRGAKSGAKWGALAGGALGLGGLIAVASGAGGLSGNAQMLGMLGALGGGVLAGALIGGGIGALAGSVSDDRKTGPRKQKRRRLQAKRRDGASPARDSEAQGRDEAKAGVPGNTVARATNGEPLDASSRAQMEARFGERFEDVRVHRGAGARALTGAMNAFAVTGGTDIYFADDGYAPGTRRAHAILAHELAHVAQQRHAAMDTPEAALEAEAAHASSAVGAGHDVRIRHGSARRWLPVTRTEKTLEGAGIGLLSGGAAGALAGLGIAAATGGALGAGALIGGLIGGGIGALAGGIAGFLDRRTKSETIPEADMLIRRRFGRFLPGGTPGPLRGASVHVVQSGAELCERFLCRHSNIKGAGPTRQCDPGSLLGWTDTGVPVFPTRSPQDQPAPVASQADEPVCSGGPLEHATPSHPVIYYAGTAGTLIHEGLHAWSSTAYDYLGDFVTEGTTEYFTRELQTDIDMAPCTTCYPDEVAAVSQLMDLVGKDTVAAAYFGGGVPALHQAVNAQLGACGLAAWAFSLQMGSFEHARAIMEGRHGDYCNDPAFSAMPTNPGKLTPAMPGPQKAQPGAAGEAGAKP
ncbi:eCIS core domain-containing protein [Paraburkholderia sp. J63]|uniref:eCIS core domain-containing protein n=1 Tax=Paraburkholderia sp. J63 TaxID=2805434 RepID=UPI002ABDA9EE|nr:DUF4157 domain-containing protein [Paraburkholderia sp. J63]